MEVSCLSESTDGAHQTRQEFGLFEFEGTRADNIVWTGKTRFYWESLSLAPFRESPDSKPDKRYEVVALGRYLDESGEMRNMAVDSLRVEIQDSNGNPISGLALDDCVETYGDEIERVVRSKNAGVGSTANPRFVMKGADLYSIRFRE